MLYRWTTLILAVVLCLAVRLSQVGVLLLYRWTTPPMADHYILPCDFYLLSSIYLLSFFYSSPNLSGRRLDVYHTFTHGVALVRMNLECRSEMCCWRLAANTGRKSRQKSPSGHHRTTSTDFAALNRGRHLCSAGRPSRWALAHILVYL